MLSCYLLYSGICSTAEQAMALFARRRTMNDKGVTIASQRRYVHYFADCLRARSWPSHKELKLQLLVLRGWIGPSGDRLFMRISLGGRGGGGGVVHESEGVRTDSVFVFAPPHCQLLVGDVHVVFARKHGGKALFGFWINTAFVDGDFGESGELHMHRKDLDGTAPAKWDKWMASGPAPALVPAKATASDSSTSSSASSSSSSSSSSPSSSASSSAASSSSEAAPSRAFELVFRYSVLDATDETVGPRARVAADEPLPVPSVEALVAQLEAETLDAESDKKKEKKKKEKKEKKSKKKPKSKTAKKSKSAAKSSKSKKSAKKAKSRGLRRGAKVADGSTASGSSVSESASQLSSASSSS